MDHVGVMANCVRDLAVVYEAIAGTDGESGRAFAIPAAVWLIDQRLSADTKQPPPRFTRLRGMFDELAEPGMRLTMDRLVFDLRSLSSTQALVTDAVPPAGFSNVPQHHRTIMAVEAAVYHAERLAAHPDDYPPRIRELIEEGRATSAVQYRKARLERDSLEIQLDDPAVWSGHYVTPATTGPAPKNSTTGDPVFNSPWSFTGLPTISLPIARSADGLPLAVQLVGKSEHDGWLLEAAAWVERVVGFERRLPPVP
jgi:aspartyl-tRNA(Asn)/glutamyl-tRNA(Gln) amidotransferase subunit A